MATQQDSTGTIIPETYDISGATKVRVQAQITVTGTATLLSALLTAAGEPAIPAWALTCFVIPEGAGMPAIRYRTDGTAPTASVGTPISQWQPWPVQDSPSLAAMQLISVNGGNCTTSLEFAG